MALIRRGTEHMTDAEARGRLAKLRREFIEDGDRVSAGTLDWLLTKETPVAAYRIIFGGDAEYLRRLRDSLPPFRPEALAPVGAKGVPRDARGHTHAGIRL